MPAQYIYEPWTAPLAVQKKAQCVIGKDYPHPGGYSGLRLGLGRRASYAELSACVCAVELQHSLVPSLASTCERVSMPHEQRARTPSSCPFPCPWCSVVDHADASKLCKERMAIAYGSPSARSASATADAKGTHPDSAKRSAGTGKRRQSSATNGEEEGGEGQEEEGAEEETRRGKAGGHKPTQPRAKKAPPPSKGGSSKRQRTLAEFKK